MLSTTVIRGRLLALLTVPCSSTATLVASAAALAASLTSLVSSAAPALPSVSTGAAKSGDLLVRRLAGRLLLLLSVDGADLGPRAGVVVE